MKKTERILIAILIIFALALTSVNIQYKKMEREQRERAEEKRIEYIDSIISHHAIENVSDILGDDMQTRIIYQYKDTDGKFWTVFGTKDTLYYDYLGDDIVELDWVVPDTENN